MVSAPFSTSPKAPQSMGGGQRLRVGISLHPEMMDAFLSRPHDCALVEIVVENWFSAGPHHAKLDAIACDYPIFFHCVGLNLGGQDPLDYEYLATIKSLAKRYKPQQISDHLSLQADAGRHFHDLLPIPFCQRTLSQVKTRVTQVQDFLGGAILLENLSYYVSFCETAMHEWDFFNQLMASTGCGMLLDLNNLWVNQHNLGLSASEFLQHIHWPGVKEIHLAGPEPLDSQESILLDTHGSDVPQIVLDWAHAYKEKLQDIPIIYERDAHINGLEALMSQVTTIRKALTLA